MLRRWMLAIIALLFPVSAGALPYLVEEWSVQAGDPGGAQVSFFDDFEDGVFSNSFYTVACGSVGPGDESGGYLALSSPGSGCGTFPLVSVAANVGFSSPATVTALFQHAVPPLDQSYGITIANESFTDSISMVVATTLSGTFITLADENLTGIGFDGIVSVIFLPPGTFDTIELGISVTESGGLLVPTGSYVLDGPSGSIAGQLFFCNGLVCTTQGTLDPSASPFFGAALIATPEPSLLLFLGLAIVGTRFRRRSR